MRSGTSTNSSCTSLYSCRIHGKLSCHAIMSRNCKQIEILFFMSTVTSVCISVSQCSPHTDLWVFCLFSPSLIVSCTLTFKLQPQEISPPPTANLDRSNDKVYENVTGLVKAVIEMSSKIQPAPPEEYVPMVKVTETHIYHNAPQQF